MRVTDPSRRNVETIIRNQVSFIVVAIEISAKPLEPFKTSQQSLLSLYITFMDPVNQTHRPPHGFTAPGIGITYRNSEISNFHQTHQKCRNKFGKSAMHRFRFTAVTRLQTLELLYIYYNNASQSMFLRVVEFNIAIFNEAVVLLHAA